MGTLRYLLHHERWAGGDFTFDNTGVEIGDDGIKHLRHYVTIPQNDWNLTDDSGTSTFGTAYDSGTSRIYAVVTCVATGTHQLRTRFQLPRDYGTLPANPISLYTYRSNPITSLKASLYKAGVVDASINATTVEPSASATWEQFQLTPGTTYSAGDWLTLQITYVSDGIGETIRVADVDFVYWSARGNY